MMEDVNQGLKVFEFNGNAVTFKNEDDVMINATEMSKPFGKKVAHFLENNQTKEFISVLAQSRNSDLDKFVVVQRGGNNPGTWMHKKLALKFAAWLNPEFEMWVYDRIEELAKYGMTATQPTIENILQDPDMAINLLVQLKAERAEKQRLAEQNDKLHQRTQFIDAVFDSTSLITISQAAKVLQLDKGRNKLFETLRQKGIFYKNSNEPLQQYINSGYFKLKEKCIQRNNHPDKIVMQPFVTQKGLAFIAKTLGVVIPNDKRMILN